MPTSQNTIVKQNEETPLSHIIFKYLPYWPIFVFFIIFFGILGYLFINYAAPKYEATATLIVKDQKKGYDDSKLTASLDQITTNTIIDNEIEIIQSRTLMINVARTLRLYAPVFEDKFIPTSAYISSPVLVESPNPDYLTEYPKIVLKYNKNNGTVTLDDTAICKINTWVKTPYGTLRFINNPKYDSSKASSPLFFSLVLPRNAANKMLSNLLAFASGKLSSVIDLSYRDQVPQLAEDILNSLLTAYNQASLIDKSTLAKNTLSFVEGRLAIVSHELDSIEKQIQQFKAGTGSINLSSQGELYLQNVSVNDQKLGDVNEQLSVLNEVDKFVQNKGSTGIVPSTLGINDPVLTQLTTNLYTSELEYERLKNTVAENNPLLISLQDQINKIKPDILNNIASRKKSLEASRNNLSSTNNSYNSVLQNIPAKERQLLEISRAQAIKNNIYSFLLQKREESELSYASFDPDSRVVDNAQASLTPVFPPRPILIYLASIIVALIFTVGLIMAKDLLNTKILYRDELEKLTPFPIIGEIAYKKSSNPIVIEEGKRSFIAEEFRKIRVALSFLGVGEKSKKILVTSSIPGEGKSFVAVNLAMGLALTGKKVVLVDLDLNNPVLGKILNVDEEYGISDYLTEEKEPDEIINRIGLNENLFFVPTGTLPDGPSELLSNGRIKDIIAYLDNVFDFVIIDTAPVFAVTDTYLLSDYCDATLYVVRHNYTPKMLIKRLVENNKINPLTNPAIIFNGLKPRGFFKNKNGYGYGYVYDYKQKQKRSKKLPQQKKSSLV